MMDNNRFDEEEVLDGALTPVSDADERSLQQDGKHVEEAPPHINDTGEEMQEHGGAKHLSFALGMLCGVLLVLIFMSMFLFRYRRNLQGGIYGGTGESGITFDLDAVNIKLTQIESLINEVFLNEVDQSKIEEGMYDGVLDALEDPYSQYYSLEEVKLLDEATSGEYSGIGATLTQDPETNIVTVVNCFEDSPAMEAGLLSGDVITKINGDEIEDMDLSEIVARIKTDKGDTITLTISRDEEIFDLEMERRKIEVPTVKGEMLDNGIGYIQLLEFDTVTADQFKETLDGLLDEGMESLIVDLRDNPGGVLQVVVEILDQILPEGMIVYTEDKYGNREEFTSDEEHKLEIPMAVLINENSASASEIFAGAVKDYGIATLVGKTTFGKGIVQCIYTLTDGTAVKLTVSKYYTPNGSNIHEIGIEPDIELELEIPEGEAYSMEADNQLQKAVEILSQTEEEESVTAE